MKSNLPKKFKQGDELTASLINDILEEIWRWRQMEAMPPLHVSEADSSSPPVFSFYRGIIAFAWGSFTSSFPAASPATPQSQTVTLYDVTGTPVTAPTLTAQSSTVTAWSPYTVEITVSSGSKVGGFVQTTDGTWWIITADC